MGPGAVVHRWPVAAVVTPVETLPAEAESAESVQVAGKDRRPPSPDRRGVLIGAIVFSAALHIGIGGLFWGKTVQGFAQAPEDPMLADAFSVDIVVDAPVTASLATTSSSVPASGSNAGTTGRAVEQTPGPEPDATRTASLADPKEEHSVVEPAETQAASLQQPAPQSLPPQPLLVPMPPKRPDAPPSSATPPHQSPEHSEQRASGTEPAASLSSVDTEPPPPGASEAGATQPVANSADTLSDVRGDAGETATSAGRSGAVSVAGRAEVLNAYGRLVWARIAAHRPKGLRLAGHTEVSFTIESDGTLQATQIVRPSGNAELDRLALHTVHAAAPYPPPPPALGPQPLTFEISFAFH